MANETYLSNVDTEKVSKLLEETGKNVEYFNNISLKTAQQYSKSLDDIMVEMSTSILNAEDFPTEVLERYLLELTNAIYFMGVKLEQLGIYNDMSSSAAKEIYNKAYLNSQTEGMENKTKPTVAALQAVAEQESQYEGVVNSIYERAYKVVKFKVEAAYKLVDVLRGIIRRRTQEEYLSSVAGNIKTDFTAEE